MQTTDDLFTQMLTLIGEEAALAWERQALELREIDETTEFEERTDIYVRSVDLGTPRSELMLWTVFGRGRVRAVWDGRAREWVPRPNDHTMNERGPIGDGFRKLRETMQARVTLAEVGTGITAGRIT